MVNASRLGRRLAAGWHCAELANSIEQALVQFAKSDVPGAPSIVRALAREVQAVSNDSRRLNRPTWPPWRIAWLLVNLRVEAARDPRRPQLFAVLHNELRHPSGPGLREIDCKVWHVAIEISDGSSEPPEEILEAAAAVLQ